MFYMILAKTEFFFISVGMKYFVPVHNSMCQSNILRINLMKITILKLRIQLLNFNSRKNNFRNGLEYAPE